MPDDQQLRVDPEYFVNEATLELLQHRIASGVKTSLVAWVGAPVGLLGILAVVYAIFFTIPQEVTKATNTFLQGQGQPIVQENVQAQVQTFLTGPEGQTLINSQVKQELEPTLTALLDPMKNNANKLIAQAQGLSTPKGVERFEKTSVDRLFRFLDSPDAEHFRSGTFDIALSKHIFRGPIYDPRAIEIHIDALTNRFGKRFRHVVLYDPQDRFIARIDPKLFKSTLFSQKGIGLMKVINARPNDMTLSEATKTLNQIFEMPVTDWVRDDWKLVRALKEPAWGNPLDPTREVAVVNGARAFIGTTTRGKLLKEIFDEV